MGAIGMLLHPNKKQMGILQMESYQYQDAEDGLLEAYRKNPNDLVTLKSLSRIYKILGNPDKEIFYLKKYLKIRPKDTKVRKELAKVYLWNLKQDLAKKQYEEILTYDPKNIDVLKKLATSYTWEQLYEQAIDCYRKVQKLQGMSFEDYQNLIKLHISMTQLDEALKQSRLLHKRYAKKIELDDYLNLADLYLWKNEFENSIQVLDRMVRKSPRNIDLKSSYIDWLSNIDAQDVAVQKIQRWLRNDPKNIKLLEILADFYLNANRTDDAMKVFTRILALDEAKDSHRLQYFWLLHERKKRKEAYTFGKTLSKKLKERENLWPTLGYLSYELGLYDESIDIWKYLISKNPDHQEAHELLFTIYQKTSKKDLAFQELLWLLERFPDHDLYVQYAVTIYLEKNEIEKAFQWAKHGLNLKPSSQFYMESIVTCATKLKDWRMAKAQLRELQGLYPNKFEYWTAFLDILIALKETTECQSILNSMWDRFSEEKKKAEKIADYYGYCDLYQFKFKALLDLESREEGDQYAEALLESAVISKNFKYAEPRLAKKMENKTWNEKEYKWLRDIYQETVDQKKELYMLEHDAIKMYLKEEEVLKRLAQIYFDMGNNRKAVDYLIKRYEAFEPENEKLKAEILKKCQWVEDVNYQMEVFSKFGDLETADGVILADLLISQKNFEDAQKVLMKLKPPHSDAVRAHELLMYCAVELGDDEAYLEQLNSLVEKETEPNKASNFLSQRASLYHQKGEHKLAYEDVLRALDTNPQNQQARVVLGYIYFDWKKYPLAAETLKRSESKEIHDRFLMAASYLRFPQGYREGRRQFEQLLREHRRIHSFKRWNLELDIGFEIKSPYLIERAWHYLTGEFYKEGVMPRYALHLHYTGRRVRAEQIFKSLEPSDLPNYITLQKIYDPINFDGKFSVNEKLALADFYEREGDWYEASLWLP